ncbi:hypothetical protein K0U07_02670 [bacterium]|nr:hypothetical protein [bacterium]
MAKRGRRGKRRKRLTVKERKKRMLKGSEWILLGILFVGISEAIVQQYDLTWRYLPYAFAVIGVLALRFLLAALRLLTSGMNSFLDSINDR